MIKIKKIEEINYKIRLKIYTVFNKINKKRINKCKIIIKLDFQIKVF